MARVVNMLVIKGVLTKKAEKKCGFDTSSKWQICN